MFQGPSFLVPMLDFGSVVLVVMIASWDAECVDPRNDLVWTST